MLGITPYHRALGRRLTAAVCAVSLLITTTGMPIPAPLEPSDQSAAYPCQYRRCGCATAVACWSGDCCCFKLEEKIAWARRHQVALPAIAVAAAARKGISLDQPAAGDPACCIAQAGDCCSPAKKLPPCCQKAADERSSKPADSRENAGAAIPEITAAAPAAPVLEAEAGWTVRWISSQMLSKCRGLIVDWIATTALALPPAVVAPIRSDAVVPLAPEATTPVASATPCPPVPPPETV